VKYTLASAAMKKRRLLLFQRPSRHRAQQTLQKSAGPRPKPWLSSSTNLQSGQGMWLRDRGSVVKDEEYPQDSADGSLNKGLRQQIIDELRSLKTDVNQFANLQHRLSVLEHLVSALDGPAGELAEEAITDDQGGKVISNERAADSDVQPVVIQFTRLEQEDEAYKILDANFVLYEELLYSFARLEKQGLSILRRERIEFEEADYAAYLDKGATGKQLRKAYLKAQRKWLGYNLD
jgi:hypothetical protein